MIISQAEVTTWYDATSDWWKNRTWPENIAREIAALKSGDVIAGEPNGKGILFWEKNGRYNQRCEMALLGAALFLRTTDMIEEFSPSHYRVK